jgi:hypothetical protein
LTVDDIATIEQALDIRLPEELKQKYLSSELDEVDNIETLGLGDYLNKPEELKSGLLIYRDEEVAAFIRWAQEEYYK